MEDLESTCASLRSQITETETRLAALKRQLDSAEKTLAAQGTNETSSAGTDKQQSSRKWPLLAEEYRRYGRQMIVPQVGLEGQLKLRSSSVLIVGAGGLGCPAAQYLAGAGVGTLGLVDGDVVEHSNLHRQVLHRTRNVGKLKVDSAIESLKELNPYPKYVAHRAHLTPEDAPEIFRNYDIVLDCTDNPATRYLISDTAVLLGKPLVSASALRTEGQLMVLNNPPQPPGEKAGGPCYRCVFPKPPPADSVVSCADGGILGPVVGTMGVLQALEAIKVITGYGSADNANGGVAPSPSLHIFSAYSSPPFRTIRLRPRRANCAACSANATVSLESLRSGSTDYVLFCGSATTSSLLSPEERISVKDLQKALGSLSNGTENENRGSHTILDVRDNVQFDICRLDRSVNVPISKILSSAAQPMPQDEPAEAKLPDWVPAEVATGSEGPIYVVCRLGNDSQTAVKKLKELGLDRAGSRFIGDIRGGLRAWRDEVDPEFPDY
ncbi:sulfurtransferase uba4 [Paecilomyces variotii No. 5]|uniref:Adenylyltransferase and sulfurtransferase uba4 n=1 Tax=Byssochlamys spectabilis (strain No. 5 / NBRC 109023) TaxID=1356009 RepID=V5FW33_BYSSN|nr:sulfurtransferase uba4 [Paecilomyces variotii No. 5]